MAAAHQALKNRIPAIHVFPGLAGEDVDAGIGAHGGLPARP
jgi:hypothetical protein